MVSKQEQCEIDGMESFRFAGVRLTSQVDKLGAFDGRHFYLRLSG